VLNASKNKIISKREDGFTVSLATSKDYLKLIDLASNLSEQSTQFFHPWMFRKNPPLKTKIGQTVVKLSLNPRTGKLIKTFFPFGYAVILKCVSPDNEIVGMSGLFKFKKLPDCKFRASTSSFVIDEFQSQGIHTFVFMSLLEIAKRVNVRIIESHSRADNVRVKKTLEKFGWKYEATLKGASKYKGKFFDSEVWIYEFSN